MAIVKLILDVKDQAWIDSNGDKVLLLNEPCYHENGTVAYGDGVSELQYLIFKPLFSGSGVWGGIVGDINDQVDLQELIGNIYKFIQFNGKIITSDTPTPEVRSANNLFTITNLSEDAVIGVPFGIVSPGNRLIIAINDDGVARNISFNPIYNFNLLAAPTITIPGKTLFLEFIARDGQTGWDRIL